MKKDKVTKEYLETLKNITLSENSRTRIEGELLEYARFHAVHEDVRVSEVGRSIEQVPGIQSGASLFTLFLRPKSMTAAIIAIALIAGGGTSYAAEGAVPGDALYVVKTEVNENIKSAFAISNEAKARLQARLAEERLLEAQELATRGELSATAAVELSTRLQNHAAEAETRSAKVEATGNSAVSADIRATLAGSLQVYANLLHDLNSSVAGNDGALLITNIRAYAESITDAQSVATTTLEASADLSTSAKAIVERADTVLTNTTATLDRTQSDISIEAYTRANAKLREAVELQAEARASLKAEAYAKANTSAQAVLRLTSEVDAIVSSALQLKIDILSDMGVENVLEIGNGIEGAFDTGINTDAGKTKEDAKLERLGTQLLETDIEINAEAGATVTTDMIEAGADTNTSVRSGIGL